jgi:hypothetical protein
VLWLDALDSSPLPVSAQQQRQTNGAAAPVTAAVLSHTADVDDLAGCEACRAAFPPYPLIKRSPANQSRARCSGTTAGFTICDRERFAGHVASVRAKTFNGYVLETPVSGRTVNNAGSVE